MILHALDDLSIRMISENRAKLLAGRIESLITLLENDDMLQGQCLHRTHAD